MLSMTGCRGKPERVWEGVCVRDGVRLGVTLLVCVFDGVCVKLGVPVAVVLGVSVCEALRVSV